MPNEFTQSTVIAATNAQVSTQVKGETVLLQLNNGKYYTLNRVGSAIWERLKTPTSIAGLVDFVVQEFEVERAQCEGDVERLVASLSDAGFVEVRA